MGAIQIRRGLDVRYAPDSGGKAGIARGPGWANGLNRSRDRVLWFGRILTRAVE